VNDAGPRIVLDAGSSEEPTVVEIAVTAVGVER